MILLLTRADPDPTPIRVLGSPGLLLLFLCLAPADARAASFATHCAGCHGGDGRGTAKGPGLAMNPRIAVQSAEQLRAYLQRGNLSAGMPSFADLSPADLQALARHLLRLNVETIVPPAPAADAARKTTWGPPQPGDWRSYNGDDSANRYSPLKQITTANVQSLKLKWVFPSSTSGWK